MRDIESQEDRKEAVDDVRDDVVDVLDKYVDEVPLYIVLEALTGLSSEMVENANENEIQKKQGSGIDE